MSWIVGTATNYQDFADDLLAACVGTSIQSVTSIAAGGTGYAVGNVLSISGGTSLIQAQVEVTTIGGGGAVTGVRVVNAGIYTTAPGNPASTTGGAGTGCTINLTWGTNGWAIRRAVGVAGSAQSATVAAGGTGYTLNDILTVSGGTSFQTAQFRVTGVSSGVVTAVALERFGYYTSTPANAASTTGGTGTGCTLNITYGTGEREIIVEGIGSGSDQVFVGWRTFFDPGSGARNVELAGFTGFNAGLAWDNQPGVSPGRFDVGNTGGSFICGSNGTTNFWISVNGRRISGCARPGTNYFTFYAGLLNPFATAGEWPYPLFISTGNANRFRLAAAADAQIGSAISPWSGFGGASANVRLADGTWRNVANALFATSRQSTTTFTFVYPGNDDSAAFENAADEWFPSSSTSWGSSSEDVFDQSTTQVTRRLLRTPNTGGDLVVLFPATVMRAVASNDRALLGEMDGQFAFDGQGGISSENVINIGSRRFRVFQSGSLTDAWRHTAIEEV